MGHWDERIKSHSVWADMANLGAALDTARTNQEILPQDMDGVERVRSVLTFTGKRLAGADPQLTAVSDLDSIAGALRNSLIEVQSYISNGQSEHISNANVHADAVLEYLTGVHYSFAPDDWHALREAGISYRESLVSNFKQLRAEFEGLTNRLIALDSQIASVQSTSDQEKTKLDALTTDMQAKFSDEQNARAAKFADEVRVAISQLNNDAASLQQRMNELANEVTAERSRLTSLASDIQSQFSSAQESRSREFADIQAKRQETFGNVIADYKQKLAEQNSDFTSQRETIRQQHESLINELDNEYKTSAGAILNEIQQSKTAVETLVGVIGNLGVTSGYLRTANASRTMTWIWQGITVAAMITLIIFAYRAFLPSLTTNFTWPSFAGRVFLSLAVGVLAAYGASQADKYLEVERRNRKLALELEAMGPYLSPLPVDKQQEFRMQVGERTFGRDEGGFGRRAERSPSSVVDLLLKSKDFQNLLSEVVKAVKIQK